jgi:hypothetical protein
MSLNVFKQNEFLKLMLTYPDFKFMKKILFKNYSLVFAAILIYGASTLTGCLASSYLPNNHNVPLLKEQGELRGSASFNLTQPATTLYTSPSAQVNLAYAPTKNIGLILNGGFSGKGFTPLPVVDSFNFYRSFNGLNGELGVGFFTPMANDNLRFEIYALGGLGSTASSIFSFNRQTLLSQDRLRVGYTTLALQPVIGYRMGVFEAALSLKAMGMNFRVNRNQNNVNVAIIDEFVDGLETAFNPTWNFMLEPALTLRGGWDNVKIQGQVGMNAFVTSIGGSAWGSLGVQFNLNPTASSSKGSSSNRRNRK